MTDYGTRNSAGETARPGQDDAAAWPQVSYGRIEPLLEFEIERRALRMKFLPGSLFADPAWDMLLELYRWRLRQHRVSISRLCAASQVPSTTALRWIGALESVELITRRGDPLDRRRVYVELTDAGFTAMNNYFLSSASVDAIAS